MCMGPYRILLDCGLRDLSPLFEVEQASRSQQELQETLEAPLSPEKQLPKKKSNPPSRVRAAASASSEAEPNLRDFGTRTVSVLNAQVGSSLGDDPKQAAVGDRPTLDSESAQQSPIADFAFCSHAHADHARGLLEVHRKFPQMPVYGSAVTAQLLPLNWPEDDVPEFCTGLEWRSPIQIFPDLSIRIWPAGHLPGAASVLLTYEGGDRAYSVFYSGDFLLSNSRLVDGLPLDEVRGLKPDVLILEGSYGTARHAKRRQQENHLADKIKQAIARNHSILLPTPVLGLGQELLMLLRSHHHFTGQPIDIWVDHRLGQACDAYLDLISQFPSTVQNFARHQSLFWDERIRPFVKRLPPPAESADRDSPLFSQADSLPESRADSETPAPVIVLVDAASSIERFCQDTARQWMLLLTHKVGQPSSVERSIYDQVQQSELLQQRIQSAHLTIDSYTVSDHCDGPGTTQFIHNVRPQHVVLIHGSPNHLTDLTGLEELQNRYQLHLPSADMRLELPVGDVFVQPEPPDLTYEGELTELKTTVMITLPKSMQQDERWRTFADTGIVEARWQGEELVMRGVQQPELLSQDRTSASDLIPECCDHCAFYRGQQCWNQRSPLFGFKVTPEGSCPEFKATYDE
ncbi:MAG: MBL fold metallo-hydrolase [Elainellaceae cyanobacterium]